jgi:alkyl sulfatase BDS1-like metallo-beta-lactamase superfamily hydrolase
MSTRTSHPASFHPDGSETVPAPNGGLAHRASVAHGERFERKLWKVRDDVWCMVGNGLSNQTFIEGPDGLIAIDTGECVEEMQYALNAVAKETDAPVVAVIYTHFHYVGGTAAVRGAGDSVPIWSHAGVVGNRERNGSEVGPVARSGLIYQFGITLPDSGPDALVNVGLGTAFRNAEHRPFTAGFIEPTNTFTEPTTATIAGLRVEFTPAPSDADDSVNIWFPDLQVCVNNIVWPVLFNVFAIRGEEYRDPRVLLRGLDHVASLGAEHLVGAHGPPLSGRDQVAEQVERSSDAVRFMWDQTVRGINKGLVSGELTEFVQLPVEYSASYLQTQFYGVVEHHVRQIHAGLRGFFDGDEANLFPVPPRDRAEKMIAGFGGVDAVRAQIKVAAAADDLRWAIDMATWLARVADDESGAADRQRLADLLRTVAHRTTAANIRNWCLTRARHLDGTMSTDRFHAHRFDREAVRQGNPGDALSTLRVMLDPLRCTGQTMHVAVELPDARAGLLVRRGVAVLTDGSDADATVSMDRDTWAEIVTGKISIADAFEAGTATVTPTSPDQVTAFFSWFEHPAFENA